jgi:uncharacterized protein YlxP (DUF503 family)
MHIAALTVELYIPGCSSLKQKRSRIRSLVARLHREFNVSSAEVDYNDLHQAALIACVAVSNDHGRTQQILERIPRWIERYRPDLQIVDHQVDIL